MNRFTPITIVGGGLAGISLGIGLRQRGIPVTIFEAGGYPRHRVCGEFISGRGQLSLERLGLGDTLSRAQARVATTAAFYSGNISFCKNLPEPALSISRFVLDHLLAEEFSELGGDLQTNSRWKESFGEGVVRATGRRVHGVVEGWRFFGLKVHAHNVELKSDLEMHFVPDGYVGLCKLPGDEVNICGLFRSRTTVPDLANSWRKWLKGPADSTLEQRLTGAVFDDESFCSIAGISLERHKASQRNECSIGDSLSMIPPVTGNGMSMAFESAELATEPLSDYSVGKISWNDARQTIARRCDGKFMRRLIWSEYLQSALFQPLARDPLLLFASLLPGSWHALFSHTR